MSSKLKARDKEGQASEDSNSVSSEPESDKPPSTVATRQRRAQASILPVAAAASAAAPTAVPTAKKKKPRKAGFREQFLQKLRVMLDRESQNDDATIRWSNDGSSFIIIDQTRFEEETIPTYFGNPIVFASFLRKLQRWGFNRVSSRRSGRYEYSSPAFKRRDPRVAHAAAATGANNATGNDGGGASIQADQQALHLLQQVMAQLNQQPVPAPPPAANPLPSQADANANAITDLISNMQRITQQLSTSSQPPGLDEYTNQMDIAHAISTLQNAIGSNQQQPIMSQQPVPNHASQLNSIAGNNYAQSFQQWQDPNPTMNMLNTILQNVVRGPTSSAQATSRCSSYPSPHIIAVLHELMGQFGMLPTPAMSQQPNDMSPVLSLLQLLQRFNEEEHQRRAQVDALHHVIISTIGHIVGRSNMDEEEGQREAGQTSRGRTRETTTENTTHIRNPTGMTVRVPHNSRRTHRRRHQEGAPPPFSADNNNIQADSIAAILHAALIGDATTHPAEDARAPNNASMNNNSGSNQDGFEDKVDGSLSPRNRKRKASDNYDDLDDDHWNRRLRKRKKSPRK